MPRGGAADVIPGSFRSNEQMHLDFNTGIAVDAA
jgi:hypothetical protein